MREYRWGLFDACPKCGAQPEAPCVPLTGPGPMRSHHAGRRKLTSRGKYRANPTNEQVNRLLARHLVYLLAQYDRLIQAHALVVMDTPEDRELHSRVIAEFRKAADPVRQLIGAKR